MSTNAKSIEVFPEQLPGQTITGKWARLTFISGVVLTGLVGPSKQLGKAFVAIQVLRADDTMEPEQHHHIGRNVNSIQAISFQEARIWVDMPADLFAQVKQECARLWQVSMAEIEGKSHEERIVRPRHAFFLILREKGVASISIGHACGGRNHGSVLSGAASMLNRMLTEPETAKAVNFLRYKFKALSPIAQLERKAA